MNTKDFPPVPLEKSAALDEKARTVQAIVTASVPDRDGSMILATGVDLEAYKRNPVVLWQHDRGLAAGPASAIGRCLEIGLTADKRAVSALIKFAEGTARADECWSLVKNGYLTAFSIGAILRSQVTRWAPRRELDALPAYAREALTAGAVDSVITGAELVEVSLCLVGSCPAATIAGGPLTARAATAKPLAAPRKTAPPVAASTVASDREHLQAIGAALGEHLQADYHARRPRLGQREALAACRRDLAVDPEPLIARALAGPPRQRFWNPLEPRQKPPSGIAADEKVLRAIGSRLASELEQAYAGFDRRLDLTLAALQAAPRRFTERALR
ncbi:MAG: hypothetical protein AMXMBFR33_41320 [Candidatus Xenobia bacterium]